MNKPMDIASFPIEVLLPHRGTMLLVDSILHFEHDCAVVQATPCAKRWYRNRAGNMPAWIGFELMAQTIGIHMSLRKKLENQPIKPGVLLGTGRYHSAVADFVAAEPLCIRAQLVLLDGSSLGVYACSIAHRGEVVATAALKVFEPADFELFIKENKP